MKNLKLHQYIQDEIAIITLMLISQGQCFGIPLLTIKSKQFETGDKAMQNVD